LSSDVGEALKTHFSISANRNPEALLFATRNGDPLASNNLRNRGFRSACKRAGLPKLSWHSLRHTHGTVQGTPLKLAQAQLGHSDLATTLEVYTHASAIAQREAVNLLENKLFPSVPKKAVESGRKEEAVSPIN
jgi:integrase